MFIINSKISRSGNFVVSTDIILIPTNLKILQLWYLGVFMAITSGILRPVFWCIYTDVSTKSFVSFHKNT
jgi:hypothetical protein